MTQIIVAAYTKGGSYPSCVNVRVEDPRVYKITVRSPIKADGSCGETAEITLTPAEFNAFLQEMVGTVIKWGEDRAT